MVFVCRSSYDDGQVGICYALEESAADYAEHHAGLFSQRKCIFVVFGHGFEPWRLVRASSGQP